jgi:ribonuclease HI
MNKVVTAYTDGSCLGNPGKGGWGVIIQWEDGETQLWGNSPHSTNNEMELTAALSACQELVKNNIQDAVIFTDSNYVKRGITEWMPKWRQNKYCGANKKQIKNMEIWKLLDEEQTKIDNIEWKHVKAHNGHPINERVDKIARDAAISDSVNK